MTEWGVVGVLISLVGFLAVVIKPMISLNTNITQLNANVKSNTDELRELNAKNREDHKEIYRKLDGHEHTLNEHETKLAIILREEHIDA